MNKTEWILCPVCGSKTRTKTREDTVLENFPLFCPRCKNETVINAKQLSISLAQPISTKENNSSYQ